jgi:hypothetical protein
MEYQIVYGHAMADCTPGTLTLKSENDADALIEVRKFIADGYRDESWAALDLQDGRSYSVRNIRGNPVGQYN